MTIPTGSGAVGDHSYYTVAFNKSSSWTNKARGPWSQVSSDQPGGLLFHSYNPTVDSGYDLYPQDGFEFSIDLSFCSPGFDGRVKSVEIEARRPRASDEPASLSAGVQQLGATRNTMTDEERGVLTLNSTSLFRQLSYERDIILQERLVGPAFPTSAIFDYDFDPNESKILPLDTRYWFDSEFLTGSESSEYLDSDDMKVRSVSEDRVALFQAALKATNSPARVMQTVYHTLLTDRYYKYQPYFTERSTQSLSFARDAIQPVRSRGYIIVVSGIAAHLVLVTYICVVLGVLTGTKESINAIDQAWQAQLQVAMLAMDKTLSEACTLTSTDDDVDATLTRRGIKDKVFRLERTIEGDVAFVARA
jgi:hypothetical protein